ncbi:hypothetical protein OG494_06065 [Amycolatopsis sp. NBC_00438]
MEDSDRLVEQAHFPQQDPEIGASTAFALAITQLSKHNASLLVCGNRLLELPHLLQREPEIVQRDAFAVAVAQLSADRETDFISSDLLQGLRPFGWLPRFARRYPAGLSHTDGEGRIQPARERGTSWARC